VWSAKYGKFFSVPHAYATPGVPLPSFLMESPDGVSWTRTYDTPVLPTGPAAYDNMETGYGRILPDPASGPGEEKWVWLYRSGRTCPGCANNNEYYTFSVARADDIRGPWVKDAANPVFDPFVGHVSSSGGALIGIDGLIQHDGWYEMLWQGAFGTVNLARSRDLRTWEDYVPSSLDDGRPFGKHFGPPVFASGGGPNEVIITSGTLVWDSDVGRWAFVYTGWTAGQLADNPNVKGATTINLARAAV
jgi:hypothetical protein